MQITHSLDWNVEIRGAEGTPSGAVGADGADGADGARSSVSGGGALGGADEPFSPLV